MCARLNTLMLRLGGAALLFLIQLIPAACPAQTQLPGFDFTLAADRAGWIAAHDIANLTGGSEGLSFRISGSDPYLTGPARDYPTNQALWARLRLRSEAGGSCQLFYYASVPMEANSVRFSVPAGRWVEGRVPLPPLGKAYRIRIDPPGTSGSATLARLAFEPRVGLPDFDFATVPDVGEWSAAHHISSLGPTLEGLNVQISGGDPYLFGPSRNYPTDTLLWLNLRLFSEQGGSCQVFYFTTGPTEEQSVRFFVPAGTWHHARVPVPALGANVRLRIDPPGSGGICLLGRLWFEERILLPPPQWPKPSAPEVAAGAPRLESGSLILRHDPASLGAFTVEVAGQTVAIGNRAAQVGYLVNREARWIQVQSPARPASVVEATVSNLLMRTTTRDPDGADWTFENHFRVGPAGVIGVESRFQVDQDRQVLYFPAFTLLPGVGSWGTNKNQGLFAGIEYLENEPSSSEADLEGPDAWRLVPDSLKSTFPLMAMQRDDRYVGLTWEPQTHLTAVFDSPDRQFGSGGHLMGLLFPGSDGSNREQRSLIPYDAVQVRANSPWVARAEILGGQGRTVIPAVQQYVALHGLPPLPPAMPSGEYYELAARGWLDSRIRETNLFRHAYWPGFNAQPASDAALWMRWLAGKVSDVNLAGRLTQAAAAAIAQVTPAHYNASQIGHLTTPAPALIFGSVLENAAQAESRGQALRQRFQADGTVLYEPRSGGLDYGRTHWARHANGLTAAVTVSLLEAAAFSGDPALIDAALKQVRRLAIYRDGVPRGAQTWEIPLHTPDILASAYLVRAYTLAYELSGDATFLEDARYWAWTGVPFVYLRRPVEAPIGAYATIPVLGATAWVAPVWIGLPVQWCGLVYAQALYGFAPYDPTGPWLTLADGITISGVQQSWPATDPERQGLLPDIFQLRSQVRDGPAINPATLQIPAMRYYGEAAAYTFRPLLRHGLRLHAPGPIAEVVESTESVRFKVRSWSGTPYRVLVNGLTRLPRIRVDGKEVPAGDPHAFLASEGRLVLYLEKEAEVELLVSATQALNLRPLEPGLALLSWPLAASNSILEAATDPSQPSAWAAVSVSAAAGGGRWNATVPTDWPQMFYRLRLAVP